MARIVLVHGIGQEQLSAESLESTWIPALIGGVRNAGYIQVAEKLRISTSDIRMAFYGNLFLRQGKQGEFSGIDSLSQSPVGSEVRDRIAEAWLQSAVRMNPDDRFLLSAMGLEIGQEVQGSGHAVMPIVRALARVKWFSKVGFGFAERFVVKSLVQVSQYLTDQTIRATAQEGVLNLVEPGTQVVIGHSLGSVVAFEALHKLKTKIPLFITIGSPLGLRNVIRDRLVPQPPAFPMSVLRWINVAATDDVVAAEMDISDLFESVPPGVVFEAGVRVGNGSEPHSAAFYLGKKEIGEPLGRTISV